MPASDLAQRLAALVEATPWLMSALREARALQLSNWCIGAGVLRNLVWDVAHGRQPLPHAESDIDLVYFDGAEVGADREAALQARMMAACPGLVWEVVNQASVHRWFADYFGHPVEPLADLYDAVASWPETATAVGVWLDPQDRLHLIAPHGLDDLFGLVVRRNPVRVSIATYQARIASKHYTARWPLVRVIPA